MAAVSSPSRARIRARAACPLVTSSAILFLRFSTSGLRFSPPAGSRGVMRVPSFFLSSQSSVSASALTASSSSSSSSDFFLCSSMSSLVTLTRSCLPRFIRRAASTCICPLTTINSVRKDSASSLSNWQPTVKEGPLAMTDFGDDPASVFSLSESGVPFLFFGGWRGSSSISSTLSPFFAAAAFFASTSSFSDMPVNSPSSESESESSSFFFARASWISFSSVFAASSASASRRLRSAISASRPSVAEVMAVTWVVASPSFLLASSRSFVSL
mmetsp:Transcript_11426/g.49239  ORF Transcript_11426/g.49239 Transcript_11426/m.49239 type:complete len:272 (+) Transcript_11426:724-1539(+)